ncbi:hypothetical protein SLNSH_11470, partial [Alsobacter soli]
LHARKGELRRASKAVEHAWTHAGGHPDLAAAYLDVRPGDSARDRLARAERLHALRPHDPEGRLAVAGAALGAHDYARARKALAPLLEGRPGTRVCLLMADLEEADGSAGGVREWLARASRAPRDPAWIADGVIADRWAPVSPVTGRLDAFTWGTPVEQIEAPAEPPARSATTALPSSEDVMADVDEAPAPVLEAPREQLVQEPSAPAAPVAPAPEPAPAGSEGKGTESSAAPVPGPKGDEQAAPAQAAPTAPKPEPAIAEASAVPVAAPAPLAVPAEAPGPEPKGPASAPAPTVTPAPAPQPHAPSPAAAVSPMRATGEARLRKPAPAEVVFPLASAPDDPGPDLEDRPQRSGVLFLQ